MEIFQALATMYCGDIVNDKVTEAPEKIYLQRYNEDTTLCLNEWNISEEWTTKPCNEKIATNIEYTRADAFIEKACEYLYNYNQKQVLKHGAKATLGCGEYTINVDEFRKHMKGEDLWK